MTKQPTPASPADTVTKTQVFQDFKKSLDHFVLNGPNCDVKKIWPHLDALRAKISFEWPARIKIRFPGYNGYVVYDIDDVAASDTITSSHLLNGNNFFRAINEGKAIGISLPESLIESIEKLIGSCTPFEKRFCVPSSSRYSGDALLVAKDWPLWVEKLWTIEDNWILRVTNSWNQLTETYSPEIAFPGLNYKVSVEELKRLTLEQWLDKFIRYVANCREHKLKNPTFEDWYLSVITTVTGKTLPTETIGLLASPDPLIRDIIDSMGLKKDATVESA